MNKSKLLIISVGVLLILNLSVVSYLLLSGSNKPNEGKMPREIVIEKLHFDTNQVEEYDKIIQIHRNSIRVLDDSIRSSKNKLYQLLNSNAINENQKDSLFIKIAKYQKDIERIHFNHFLEIKKICNNNQLSQFNNLTVELSKIFSHGNRPKHK